jgi:hypothetical protein
MAYVQIPGRDENDPNASADINQLNDNIEALKGGTPATAPTTTIEDLATDKLAIADIDDTPADDADTAVSSKWIYDNISKAFKVKTSSAKSGDYTITDTDGIETILMTTGASNRTVDLPTAADNTDRELTLLKVDSGAGYLIIDGEGGETIDFAGVAQTTITVELQDKGIRIKCNGTSWQILDVIGAEIDDISGTLEMIYTKMYIGTLDNDASTSVTHNITDFNTITQCTGMARISTTFWMVYDEQLGLTAVNAFLISINSTAVNFDSVGSGLQGQPYKVLLRYYI